MSDSLVSKRFLAVLKYIFLVILVFLSVGPLLWVFVSSFKTNAEVLNDTGFFPKNFTIQSYVTAIEMTPIGRFYINSVVVAVGTVFLNLAVLGMSAYAVSRFEFRFKRMIILIISLTLLIPGTALMQPLYGTINTLGLTDSLVGLIIVYAGFGLPTTFYILSSYFLTIPKEMEESAYIDGAGFVQTFIRIIIPISKPGFATAAIMQFLGAWNEFQFALILTTSVKSRTLPMALFYFKTQYSSNYGAMFAGTILVVVPSIIVYILLQEQVVSGLAAGAVKG